MLSLYNKKLSGNWISVSKLSNQVACLANCVYKVVSVSATTAQVMKLPLFSPYSGIKKLCNAEARFEMRINYLFFNV